MVEQIELIADPPPSFEGWTCPLPLRDSPTIVMGHGGGGAMSAELVEHVFLPASPTRRSRALGDSAVLELGGARLAFSTDSFVVRPLFFPGGSIGDLAVNGTVNDLAMSGAQALFLSVAFILEEGTDVAKVGAVAERLGRGGRAGRRAAWSPATPRWWSPATATGSTSTRPASGWCPTASTSGRTVPRPGDVVIVSGDIGVHGVAIMSVREGLQFGTEIESDCQPLNGLVAAMLAVTTGPPRAARPDARRGGDLAQRDRQGVRRRHRARRAALPIPEVVANACSFLGLDPLQVANEGKLLAFVAPERRRGRARRDARASRRSGRHGDRRVRRGAPRHGLRGDRLRRLAGRRPAHR